MSLSYTWRSRRTAQKHTSGFAPLVGVPPFRQRLAGHPTLSEVGVASGLNLPLTRRGGLMRRAWERAASVGGAAAPRR
jgi:hypothetical protein